MNDSNDEQWQWIDEDPIERLLRAPVEPHRSAASPAARFLAAGYEQFGQLRFEEAAGSYAAAAAADPANPTAHFNLAVCLEKTEQWMAAINSFRRSLEIDPGRTGAFIGMGDCLLYLGYDGEALDWFERSLETGGGDREAALLGKAVALQKLLRYEEADAAYREVLQGNPNWAEPLKNLVALSIAREDAASAYEYSRRLLRVDPQSKTALQGLATLAIRNGDQAAAVEYCTRLVEVDPDSFEGWFNLRYAQQRMRSQEQPARSIA